MTQMAPYGQESTLRTGRREDSALGDVRKGPPGAPHRYLHVAAALYATGELAAADELTRRLLPFARARVKDMARGA